MGHWIELGCDRMLDCRKVGTIRVIGPDFADSSFWVKEFELIELTSGVPGWTAIDTVRGIRIAGPISSLTYVTFAEPGVRGYDAIQEPEP